MDKFSVHVLVFADDYEMAGRCLSSLVSLDSEITPLSSAVSDFRIALHTPSPRLLQVVDYWARTAHGRTGLPVKLYFPEANVFKYPTMRRLLYDTQHPSASLVMWFDDDSYLVGKRGFWPLVHRLASAHDIIGQRWWLRPRGGQWAWIQTQPWCNPELQPPFSFEFCQGAWWCAKHAVLRRLNWPVPELRHNGGDSMLGEVCRHQTLDRCYFDYGVRINADEFGDNSCSERRGYKESEIAVHYDGRPLSTEHQKFTLRWVRLADGLEEQGADPYVG